MLEPYVLKGTSTVLRGERGGNTPDLPDYIGTCESSTSSQLYGVWLNSPDG